MNDRWKDPRTEREQINDLNEMLEYGLTWRERTVLIGAVLALVGFWVGVFIMTPRIFG